MIILQLREDHVVSPDQQWRRQPGEMWRVVSELRGQPGGAVLQFSGPHPGSCSSSGPFLVLILILIIITHRDLPPSTPQERYGNSHTRTETSSCRIQAPCPSLHFPLSGGIRPVRFLSQYKRAMSPAGLGQPATSQACQGSGGLSSSQRRAARLLQGWGHCGDGHQWPPLVGKCNYNFFSLSVLAANQRI